MSKKKAKANRQGGKFFRFIYATLSGVVVESGVCVTGPLFGVVATGVPEVVAGLVVVSLSPQLAKTATRTTQSANRRSTFFISFSHFSAEEF